MKVALIAGFLQSAEDLRELESALSARGFTVEPADVTELLSLDSASEAIDRFCARFQDAELWVGYSMGARLALHGLFRAQALQRAPAGLVLVSGTPGLTVEADRHERRVVDARRAAALRDDPDGFVADWGKLPLFDALRSQPAFNLLQKRRRERIQNQWVDLWSHALVELSPGQLGSLWEQLVSVRCPVLFLAGEKDPKYVEIARRAAAITAHARAEVIDHAGHSLPLENPERVANEIFRFAQEIKSSQSKSTGVGNAPSAEKRA